MKSVKVAQNALNDVRDGVIGVLKMKGKFELIVGINNKDLTVDTLRLSEFGAIHETYGLPQSYGEVRLFPDNKTMNDMLNQVFAWSDFMEQFNIL